MKHVKIQKQRFFIDGFIRLKNVLIKSFITGRYYTIVKISIKCLGRDALSPLFTGNYTHTRL